jgi:hypothetical protein
MNIKNFFLGKSKGSGVITIFGKVQGIFKVEMLGRMQGSELILTENFTYNSGNKQQRQWNFTFSNNDETIIGTANDIIGKAKGFQKNNIVQLKYRLKIEDKNLTLNFTDRLWFVDENTLLNKASIHKFGIKIGEIVAGFEKVSN